MNKFICVAMLSAIFSQMACASNVSQEQQADNMLKRIAAAKAQGLAVAQCRYGKCRDTDDGEYVDIEDGERDGYYIYDPMSSAMPEERDINKSNN